MWSIGGTPMDGRVVLGPMSGYTFGSYRRFCEPFGTAATVTEMVSASGLVHGGERSAAYIVSERTCPLGVQLFGSDPAEMRSAAEAAVRIDPGIAFIDINMGCPADKVLRDGAGSALLKDPGLCGRLIKAAKDGSGIPVTAKIRLRGAPGGPEFRDVLDEIVSAGADAVTIHPRTQKEGYRGSPHYDLLEGLGDDLPIPLIVSGNIYTLEDAVEALECTKADAVMVARGGIGNPFLITQIDRYLRDGTVLPNPTVSQQAEWCLDLARMIIDEKGEEAGIRKLRSIAPKFMAGCRYCREYRRALTAIGSFGDLERILSEADRNMGDRRVMSLGRGPLATAPGDR